VTGDLVGVAYIDLARIIAVQSSGMRLRHSSSKEESMNVRALLLTASLCAAWPVGVWADDDEHECSVATLHGSYGFIFTGTANTPGGPSPRAGVGRIEYDGRGNLLGTLTLNIAGTVVLRRTFVGTYTVAADCTGTLSETFTDALDGEATFDLVIVDDGRETRAITTPPPGTPNPATITSIGRKQFSHP
jgi:hypothetical protein